MPVGVVGELLIGGDGLARGYLNRPELTAEKFIPHPFKPEARLYRTGDLAKYRPDGNLVCLGRVDFQVKLRGYRVELGEIEAVLTRHPDVMQAVVSLPSDGPGGERLVAYVVQREGASLAAEDLRQHLRRELPEYMVPAVFVPLERFPLTPNGKVDRKALPEPDQQRLAAAAAYIAPRNETEVMLAAIWSQVLGLERVGVTDDFFDLGGHSLLAVKLFAEIESQTGRRLPLSLLFSSATIERLAREFEMVPSAVRNWSSLVPIHPKGTKPVLYCVHGAGGNVLLYRDLAANLGPDYPVYGFQSKGLDGHSQPLTTIEEMASYYLAELKSYQPEGPYCLAGYCLGGLIAYQMARLLRQSGDVVAFVALLDSYNPAMSETAGVMRQVWQRVKFHIANLTGLRGPELRRYLMEKGRVARDGEFANMLGSGVSSRGGEREGGEARVQPINDRAVGAFKPEPYHGPVVLLRPRVNYDFLPDPKMGWSDLVNGTGCGVLPVNPHAMLVEPFVRHLADALRRSVGHCFGLCRNGVTDHFCFLTSNCIPFSKE